MEIRSLHLEHTSVDILKLILLFPFGAARMTKGPCEQGELDLGKSSPLPVAL